MSTLEQVLAGKEENHILPFFWQHGEDEATLREYMKAIYDSHIRAVCIESRPHPDFCGPGWWHDMDIILEEAKKLGMKVWILDDSHFPTGFANGAVLKAPKELHHRYLSSNTVETAGPRPAVEFRVEDMIHPPVLPPWIPVPPNAPAPIGDDRLFSILACPVTGDGELGDPVVLDDHIGEDGVFRWDVPEGYWRIFVTYLTYDGRGRDDYINFLDMASCHLQIEAVYEPHWEHYHDLFGTVIAGFFSDEPPVGNTAGYTMAGSVGTEPGAALAWSDAMPERFEKSYGSSDWKKLLPYLWGKAKDADAAAKERVAYMDAVSRLVQECFSDQLGRWCSDHGVEYIGHMLEDVDANSKLGPSMGHYFRGLDGQHMAGIDNIGNSLEVGARHTGRHNPYSSFEADFYYYELGKLAASHAAIDPKKKGRAMCENFGAYGWETGVRTMKYLLDEIMVRGVNYFVPHAFSPKAFPDPDCPPHFYAHGENPEYEAFGDLMQYANRVCSLISGGKAAVSAAILYHGESDWAGDFESNAVAAKALSTAQIDYHILPADVFSEREKFHTEFDGKVLTVNGTKYPALIISGCQYLCRSAAEFVKEAAGTDFPVFVTDRMPEGISDASSKEENDALLAAVHTAKLVSADNLAEVLRAADLQDVELEQPTEEMTVYHYNNGKDFYLFLNESAGKAYQAKAVVKTKGTPALYDAWTNTLHRLPGRDLAEGTELSLSIAPLEMAVVVFDADGAEADTETVREEQVLGGFAVTGINAKTKETEIPAEHAKEKDSSLQSMAISHPDFSGWYRYETDAELKDSAEKTELVIDDAYECAKVYINGEYAGDRVAQPYVYDITKLVKEGTNHIRIDVATTLERKIRAMGEDIYSMNIHHPLSPTGIVGKVKIVRKN